MSNFLENFYGVLFSPDKTFNQLKENTPLFQGFLIVLFISVLSPILKYDLSGGITSLVWFSLAMFGAALFGVVSWLFWASFLDILASIFKQSGKIKTFLTLSAFALIPWLLIAPVELLKPVGVVGGVLGILLELFIWLWVVVLIIMAIIKTYDLSFGRVLVLMVVPFLGGFLAFYWVIGFFSTLVRILQI